MGIFGISPFENLDVEGVGELVRIGTERGRATPTPFTSSTTPGWNTSPAHPSASPPPGSKPAGSHSTGRAEAISDETPRHWARDRTRSMTEAFPPGPVRTAAAVPALAALRSSRPLVCGILNVTPDSFSDGGRFIGPERALAHGLSLVEQGADLIDIGGESTRPGAQPPSVTEELERVIPVVQGLAEQTDVPLSVDTSRPEVMRGAIRAGASMINDVRALRVPGALAAAAALGVPVCLMHMQGEPGTMQRSPSYREVVPEVRNFLADRMRAAELAGVDHELILADPGFGFGKTLEHNLTLLANLRHFATLRVPIMVGLSRKGMIGAITGRPVGQRLAGSISAAVLAVQQGVTVLRVHDVGATCDALAVLAAIEAERGVRRVERDANRAAAGSSPP